VADAIASGIPTDQPKKKRPPGRRYPFRAKKAADQPQINAEISKILCGVEDMLYQLVRRRVQQTVDEDRIQEIVQRCREWLWQRSLPKYDNWRGVKISTFLYRCAGNFINQEVRAINRQHQSPNRVTVVDPEVMFQTMQASDHAIDNQVEKVATDVLKNPEKYLTESQAVVFRAITRSPGTQMKDLARRLGYQRASSLSMMLRRIRERITEISIEDFNDGEGDDE
jgi:hypothetical protein